MPIALSITQYWDRPTKHFLPIDYGFGLKLSKMTIRQHVERLLKFVPEIADNAREFLDKHYNIFEDLAKCKAVKRMAGLRHIGWKSDKGPEHLYPHSRLDHSRHGCGLIIVFCLLLGRSSEETLLSAVSFLLHDNGHYAYGHDAERNMEQHGFPDYEERGIANLTMDMELCAVLVKHDISLKAIAKIMREEGDAGLYEMINDTLSYCELDSLFFGEPIAEDFVIQVFKSIDRIENGKIYVNNPRPLLIMLRRRAYLFKYYFCSFSSKILKGAQALVINYAFDSDRLKPKQMLEKGDEFIDSIIEAMIADGVPQWIYSAWRLVKGYGDELVHWDVEQFGTEQALADREAEIVEERDDFFVARWKDYASKKIPVTFKSGEEVVLKAKGDFSQPQDNCSWILTWNG